MILIKLNTTNTVYAEVTFKTHEETLLFKISSLFPVLTITFFHRKMAKDAGVINITLAEWTESFWLVMHTLSVAGKEKKYLTSTRTWTWVHHIGDEHFTMKVIAQFLKHWRNWYNLLKCNFQNLQWISLFHAKYLGSLCLAAEWNRGCQMSPQCCAQGVSKKKRCSNTSPYCCRHDLIDSFRMKVLDSGRANSQWKKCKQLFAV